LSIPSEHWVAPAVVLAGGSGAMGAVVVDGVGVVELVVPEVELPAVDEPPSPGRTVSPTVVSGEAVALPTAAKPRKAASARISASLLFIRLI